MAWTDPTTPNIADFYTFILAQGVPVQDLPSGGLTTVAIDTSGNLTAISPTGTISPGMVLIGIGIPEGTYILTWDSTTLTGTVSPAPSSAVSVPTAQTYSQYVQWAFSYASIYCLVSVETLLFVLATYNLGMHKLLKIGQDISPSTYFSDMRTQAKMLSFAPGVVSQATDEATSAGLVVPEFFKGLLVTDLDLVKSPWGLEYLNYKQSYGPYPVVMV